MFDLRTWELSPAFRLFPLESFLDVNLEAFFDVEFILKEPFIYYTSCPLFLSLCLSSRQRLIKTLVSRWRSMKRNTVSHSSASVQKGGAVLKETPSAILLHRCKRVAQYEKKHRQPSFCIDAKGWRCMKRNTVSHPSASMQKGGARLGGPPASDECN
jgi:hypothetical protein